jgi:hypothetical protein
MDTFCRFYSQQMASPMPDASQPKPNRRLSVGLLLAFLIWLGAVAGGTIAMVRYSEAPGTAAPTPDSWPASSTLLRDPHRPTLLMFLHPRCPCSRASVGELERLLASVDGKLDVCVAFIVPQQASREWEETDLIRRVNSIKGVREHMDEGGKEARIFGAETSGQTMLYDASGRLRFRGGITAGRGHAGDNPGRTELEQIMLHGRTNGDPTPVFGCALFETKCAAGETICKP